MSILLIFYRFRHPYERLKDLYNHEVRLLQKFSRKKRIAHMETHARCVHILAEIMRKNGHHFAPKQDNIESLSYVLPDDVSQLTHVKE